jgi:hypothetical protein
MLPVTAEQYKVENWESSIIIQNNNLQHCIGRLK